MREKSQPEVPIQPSLFILAFMVRVEVALASHAFMQNAANRAGCRSSFCDHDHGLKDDIGKHHSTVGR